MYSRFDSSWRLIGSKARWVPLRRLASETSTDVARERFCLSGCDSSSVPFSARFWDAFWSAQERPKGPQEAPKRTQERPRAPQERPRAPQESPKSAQERPKSSQGRPKSSQERPKTASDTRAAKSDPRWA